VVLPAAAVTTNAEAIKVHLVLAADAAAELAAAGTGPAVIEVDAGQVEAIGQAAFQLLLAARAEAEAGGIGFGIVNPSPVFTERAHACGLASRLGLESAEGTVR
jgi:anti-anti-sigma regulatory factor